MPRLATCNVCHVIEKMPDVIKGTPMVPAMLEWKDGLRYILPDNDGLPKMVPAFDPMLEAFVERHQHDLRDEFFTHGNAIQVMAVDQRTWETMDVLTKIKEELQRQTGEVYEEHDEYRDAALKCYNAHGNPDAKDGCSDYLDSSKMIGRASYSDDDGNTITVPDRFRQYLCYLCPFQQTYIQHEMRWKRGLYEEGPTPVQIRNIKRAEKRRRRRG